MPFQEGWVFGGGYGGRMLSDTPGLTDVLDADLVGFLTAVNAKGQPQTSPIWFILDNASTTTVIQG